MLGVFQQAQKWLPDLSRSEIRATILLSVYNFCAMCAFAMIKPVRSSLLLDRLGADWLPIGFLCAAVATGVLVWLVGRFSDQIPLRYPVFWSTMLLLGNLLGFRVLFDVAGNWVALVFYVWANLFANILLTQFWLMAGNQFMPREGKRLLGWVGAGGICGAIAGPLMVYKGVVWLGTENLIFFASGFLGLCLPFILWFERRGHDTGQNEKKAKKESAQTTMGFNLFQEFRHLKLIAIISGASIVVQSVLDYQFNAVIGQTFQDVQTKTAFFAQFFAGVNILGLALQLIVTRFVLMRYGVGTALFLLPLALMAGAFGILIYPTLMVVAVARLTEGGVRYSIQEATREVLYLPLPSEVRSKARPLIDIFGSRLFEGVAGGVILFMTKIVGVSISGLSVLSVGLIVVWGLAVLGVKREYVNALRGLFADLPISRTERAAEVLDDATVGMLVASLDQPDAVQVEQALTLLDLLHDKKAVIPNLKNLLTHPSLSVRGRALDMLAQADERGLDADAEWLIRHADGDARLSGVRYLCRYGQLNQSQLNQLVHDEDFRVRIAAIGALIMAERVNKTELLSFLKELRQTTDEKAVEARAGAAEMLGRVNREMYDDVLLDLLRDASPIVVRAALDGAAQTGRRVFLPWVISCLSDERLILYAQRTLKVYGDRVLGTLCDYMHDSGESAQLKQAIPACLAAIGTERAAQALLILLSDHLNEFGDEILEALVDLRNRLPDFEVEQDRIKKILIEDVQKRNMSDQILLRRMMTLLSLIYPADDIQRAYAGLTHAERQVRSNALELLDNLLQPDIKRVVMPILEKRHLS